MGLLRRAFGWAKGEGVGKWGRGIPYLAGLQPGLHGHEVYKYTEDGGARGDHY